MVEALLVGLLCLISPFILGVAAYFLLRKCVAFPEWSVISEPSRCEIDGGPPKTKGVEETNATRTPRVVSYV